MKRMSVAVGVVAIALGALAVACGRGNQQPAEETAPGAQAPAAARGTGPQDLTVTFNSTPTPPKTGDNTFEVMVMDQNGQPVTDADVSVEFYMAAMPEMKMPEMRNRVDLKHEADGRYRGAGNVMMAGGWDVTVRVSRNGQEVDAEKLSMTAQ